MYVFNRITVNPQLPKRIEKLSDIAKNLWWSWNTEFLRLFKMLDIDLWETCGKNPVKFLKLVEQSKLEKVTTDNEFLKEYDCQYKHIFVEYKFYPLFLLTSLLLLNFEF